MAIVLQSSFHSSTDMERWTGAATGVVLTLAAGGAQGSSAFEANVAGFSGPLGSGACAGAAPRTWRLGRNGPTWRTPVSAAPAQS